VDKIVADAIIHPAKSIVITGGEPLNYPLDILCRKLKNHGMEIFLETSGSSHISGNFDWICLSPKRKKPPVDEIYEMASELKVIVEDDVDFIWAEENRSRVKPGCLLYLQPEWSRSGEMMEKIVEYVKANPGWSISLQTHKYMNIP
jgi:organic radical activating enzyme